MTNLPTQNNFIYLPVYLSDYVSESRKLTMLQRGALIDLSVLYFQENLKLNYHKEQIYRLVFAFEQVEKDAIDFILENYFKKIEAKPMGFFWVSNQLNAIGDKVLKRLEANRSNGKKGGRGNKSENKPMGLNSLNPNESILNESKLNEIKLKENKLKLFSQDVEQLTDGLKFILEAKLSRKLNTNSWKKQIELLVEKDLSERVNAVDDVKRVIQEIGNRFGEQYFPVVESASSLREKFSKIEAAIQRNSGGATNSKNNFTNTYLDLMEEFKND